MKEYYYTRSLATAASAIGQGFDDCETWEKTLLGNKMYWAKGFDPRTEYELWRFPKSPHNVALMALHDKDVVQREYRSKWLGVITETGEFYKERGVMYAGYIDGSYHEFCDKSFIIYRNNKPFPVWDKIEEKKDGI